MPWLPEPDPDAQLWTGPLELLEQDAVRHRDATHVPQPGSQGEPSERAQNGEHEFDPRHLPHVDIGPPETWPLTALYPRRKMSTELRSKVDQHDFYVSRLRFSFRPTRDEVVIKWARFAVQLLGEGVQTEAIHPESVEEAVTHSRRYTLAPSLKFAEVTVSAGELEFGFEYTALEPFVWGASEPVTSPSWDFEPTTGHRLYGSRRMHLLIRAPRGSPAGHARLHLVTEVAIKHRLLGRATTPRDPAPLEANLWGGAY